MIISSMDQRGFSIIGVIVGAGAVLAMMVALTTYIENNLRITRGLGQKIESQALSATLQRYFVGAATSCDWQVQPLLPAVDFTILPTQANPLNITVPIPQIHEGTSSASSLFVVGNALLPGTVSNLRVGEIGLTNFYCVNDCTDNLAAATLRISWDPTSLAIPMKSVELAIRLNLDPATPLSAKRFQSCGGLVSAGGTAMGKWTETHLGFLNYSNSDIYSRGGTLSFPGPNSFSVSNVRQRARLTFTVPFPNSNYLVIGGLVATRNPAYVEVWGPDHDTGTGPSTVEFLVVY